MNFVDKNSTSGVFINENITGIILVDEKFTRRIFVDENITIARKTIVAEFSLRTICH